MEPIVYRPFRSNCLLGILLLGLSLVFLIFSPFLIPLSLLFLVCAWYMFRTSKVTVVLGDDGIQLHTHNKSADKYILWTEFRYFRLDSSLRGYDFLVLSPAILEPREAKRIVILSSFSTKLYDNGTVILPLDPLQNTDAVLKFTRQKIGFTSSQYQ